MQKKLSARFIWALVLFSLMGQVAWVVENMYFNVFIYNMFNASANDISLMVAASAVSATLTTVFMGALSDKIGKRKLFICGGYILWGISIFSFTLLKTDIIGALFPTVTSAAAMAVTLTIILDCIMTFFGSTANDAAFNAWLTDSSDSSNRGTVEGINSMMPLVAILVVFGSFMFFDLTLPESWTLIFAIIGAVVVAIGVLGIFLIKEPQIKPTETGYLHNIFYGFRPSTVKANPMIYLFLGAFAIFNISIQIFMPYLIIYYEKSLGMSDYVFIMAPAIIFAAICTALWGKVYDKKGFRFSVIFSIAWLAAGYIILFFTKTTVPVFIGSLLMMCGYLSGMAVFGAVIRDYTPEGKAGMFQGLRIFSQVLIPGVIGPKIGSTVLKNAELITNNDGTQSFLPNEKIFLAALVAAAVLVPVLCVIATKIKPKTCELKTPFEAEMKEVPWDEYPRPMMKRDSYICLNGTWALKILQGNNVRYDGKIKVPFPAESRLSGVKKDIGKKDILVYSRKFTLPDGFKKDKVLLHFGAVDQTCEVYVNDFLAVEHEGGYTPFCADITKMLNDGENTLTVKVSDPLKKELPYGKQRKDRGGMWYTPVSGIWQTVWLESVAENHIESIKITTNTTSAKIEVFGGLKDKTLVFEGKNINFSGSEITVTPKDPKTWSPEEPYLYSFELISGEDRISSYFALRKVEIKGEKILLNGKPIFFHGLLDQGYFSDGIYLPATPKGYENDILEMKKQGFNTLRKHIKIEPQLFYHYCDKYGMIVFQDFVNSGKYSFIIDTALPTVGLKKGVTHKASAYRRESFIKTAEKTVEILNNHPSVLYYTIFNEGWGQFDAENIYERFKALDPTRIWDATSGWFQTNKSDVLSEHIYFKPLKLQNDGRPLILSEFGGYSYKIDGHSFNLDKTYGYRFFTDGNEFKSEIIKLYTEQVISAIEHGLCGAILTQVSDVEDETNGLFTYDRQVLKTDTESMAEMAKQLYETFERVNKE